MLPDNSRRLILPGMHVQALDNIRREGINSGGMYQEYDDEVVPHALKRQVSVYEAGRALLAFITPGYDEISKVRAHPAWPSHFIPCWPSAGASQLCRPFYEQSRHAASLNPRVLNDDMPCVILVHAISGEQQCCLTMIDFCMCACSRGAQQRVKPIMQRN